MSDNPKAHPLLLHLPAAALYGILSLAVTYPLWLHPETSLQGLGDPALNSYILAWNHHAIFHQITEYFQANIFWPNADALAYGEHLFIPALLVLPFRLFTSSAVALHNFSLIEAYFFSALAAHALAFHFFRRVESATICGLAYGFSLYRVAQSGHIQLAHGEFLPLMILGFEKIVGGGDRKWKVLLAAAALAQWLTSWYWAVFSFWCAGPYMAGRIWQSRREVNRKHLIGAALPLLAAAILTFPFALPYIRLKQNNVLIRPPEVALSYSAHPSDWIEASQRNALYGWFLLAPPIGKRHVDSERALFPGTIPLAGFALAVWFAFRRKGIPVGEPGANFPSRLWICLSVLLLSFCFGAKLVLSDLDLRTGKMGPPLPYFLIERFFPFAAGIRVPARWMLPAALGISLSISHAWSRIRASWKGRAGASLYSAVVALMLIEIAPPFSQSDVMRLDPPAPVFGWLADQPFPSPLLELPVLPDNYNTHLLDAAIHWQPMVNGSNGFFPPDHRKLLNDTSQFPSPAAIALLREKQVRYVIVDSRSLFPINPDLAALVREAAAHRAGGEPSNSPAGEFNLGVPELGLKGRWFGRHLVIVLSEARQP
ncbi:hypothetical protein HYR69_09315 [Candidatus Sumerlaeota bacterium]|nr:hypothetical protein [Candidatus Sumerlaeota bacterium]MBI3735886.1 hypothetical protein [Candidatus Sumerlaeota bacterium]